MQVELVFLVLSLLFFASIFTDKIGYKFGVPALLLFLAVGMLFGPDGLGKIFNEDGVGYMLNVDSAQAIGTVALCIILFYRKHPQGSLREGAPDEIGWRRMRYHKVNPNLTSRRLLPPLKRSPSLSEGGFYNGVDKLADATKVCVNLAVCKPDNAKIVTFKNFGSEFVFLHAFFGIVL